MVVISVYVYGVKIINKFQWESGFLRGGVPLCTNGSAGYLTQLSVKLKAKIVIAYVNADYRYTVTLSPY